MSHDADRFADRLVADHQQAVRAFVLVPPRSFAVAGLEVHEVMGARARESQSGADARMHDGRGSGGRGDPVDGLGEERERLVEQSGIQESRRRLTLEAGESGEGHAAADPGHRGVQAKIMVPADRVQVDAEATVSLDRPYHARGVRALGEQVADEPDADPRRTCTSEHAVEKHLELRCAPVDVADHHALHGRHGLLPARATEFARSGP